MRYFLTIAISISMLLSKEMSYKIKKFHDNNKELTHNETTSQSDMSKKDREGIAAMGMAAGNSQNRETRDDTTTIWLEDFEGDISGWTVENGWELTEESSYSPTHSFKIDDDNFDVLSSIVSPILTVPEINPESELMKMNFALRVDLPDFDGDGDNYLEDYYWVDIANVSDVPVYFFQSTTDAYEGSSWWCADGDIGGYSDAWVQFLQTPTIAVPADGATLSAMMKWAIEDYAGASVAGTCTDGWDAANVRISNDGGSTWNILNSSNDPYDFYYGYGWIYNDTEYDCGGSLEAVAAGWAGQADWHEVEFNLNNYSGQDVIIQFAFGSDPAYSTGDDGTITGLKIDNIAITDNGGNIIFQDNADDEVNMIALNGLEFAWEQFFYDYGDISQPGSLDWEVYPPGAPFNGNTQLDMASYAGSDIRIRFTGRMDADDDGGNGDGLYIDDVHLWKVSVNNLPPVLNLSSLAEDASVTVTWDSPPTEQYDNDEIYYHDNSADNAYYWSVDNEIKFGSVFTIPFGAESFTVHSAMFAAENNNGEAEINTVIEGYNVSNTGIAETTPLYSMNATLESGELSEVDLGGWLFAGSFLISMTADSNVSMYVDEAAETFNSYFSSSDFGSDNWFELVEDGGGLGEWIINVNVSTTGEIIQPSFNVYRSVDGGDFNATFNGMDLTDNIYVDNFVSNGVEYCYEVEAIYAGDASDLAGPTCATPEAQTIYEIFHDDGTDETSINAGGLLLPLAVKFTPEAYPVDLYRASFYCPGTSNGDAFITVWDDDGENGMPGTVLVENYPATLLGGQWTPISLSSFDVTITEGSFYVGRLELNNTPPIGVDSDNSPENSFIDIGYDFGLEPFSNYFDGALMIRAEVDSANVLGLHENPNSNIPIEFSLRQNYPNPFNPTTTIDFSIAEKGIASLLVYDIKGRVVESIINEELNPGLYSYGFNGSRLSSGMYFYKLMVKNTTGSLVYSQTNKLILMK